MNKERIQKEKAFHDERFSQEDESRGTTDRYYSIAQSSWNYYWKLTQEGCQGKRILEYGCGTGSNAFRLAKHGAVVTGIDLSEVAIERAREIARNEGLNVTFYVMNAENLEFPENSFDIICGSGIIHHLDIIKAYSELAKVLTPNGRAILIEPLGHNPLINLYRRITPGLRTEDEHPLRMKDINAAKTFFSQIKMRSFYLTALLAIPFRKYSIFNHTLTFFEAVDGVLFSLIPFIGRYAWSVVITLLQPYK